MRSKLVKRIGLIILRIAAYILAVLGLVLTASLEWLHSTWGPVSFSTALFQLKTPMVGVDNNLVDAYINYIAMPAVKNAVLAIIVFSFLTYVMKKTSYSVKLSVGRSRVFNITYRPVAVFGTLGLLLACWIGFPRIAVLTGLPDYFDSIIHRSTIYENEYVEPSASIIHFPSQKRNLILIYVESLEASYASVEEGGGMQQNLIPNLTGLAQTNTSFSDSEMFGGAIQTQGIGWTMAALLSSTSGVTFNLPVDENDMQTYSRFLPGLTTLGDILSENGYSNYFVCGSDAGFGGRKAYFMNHNYLIHDYRYALAEGFIPSGYHNNFWGMEDTRVFDMARTELTQLASDGTLFDYTILTSDTHAPDGFICGRCDPLPGEETINTAIRCTDREVYDFVEWVMQQDWYSDTSVVILGDHLLMSDDINLQMYDGYDRRIYNCFINPYPGLEGKTLDRSFSSVDYFPTILAALGVQIDGNRLGLGTNLFSDQSTLLEQLGLDEYNTEVLRHSEYYANHFI